MTAGRRTTPWVHAAFPLIALIALALHPIGTLRAVRNAWRASRG